MTPPSIAASSRAARTLALLLPVVAAGMAVGQEHPKLVSATATTPASDANLITIPVVVHDKHGALVSNLPQDQFQLWVDKKPAEIHSFTPDTDRPLTIGLVVDVGASQRDALDEERKASASFLSDAFTARDQAFVVQYARQTDLLQDVTSAKPTLQASVRQLTIPPPGTDDSKPDDSSNQSSNSGNPTSSPGSTGPTTGSNGPYGPYGRGRGNNVPVVGAVRRPNSVLYDALFLSADQLLSKQSGRKVLILLSNGTDHGSKESLASAIEAAQRADTVVYAIYVKGQQGKPDHSDRGFSMGDPNQCDPYGPPGGYPGSYPPYGYPGGGNCSPTAQSGSVESSDGKKLLLRITDQTGGRLFELDKKNGLADIYKQIADELHARYRLTYAPDKAASSDGYHRIDVSLKGDPKELFVQTPEGYYAGSPD